MKDQQAPKRSWFAPIVLVMLVMSLMGNVVLYSQKLSNDQIVRKDDGARIIMSGWDSRGHIDSVVDEVTRLLESNHDVQERIAAKEGIGFAFKKSDAVNEFIAAAQTIEPLESADVNRTAATFLSEIERSLRSIGNHEDPLSEEEKAYLTFVKDSYTRLQEPIHKFNVSEITMQNALRIEHGGDWIELAYQMLSIMNEAEIVLYKGADNEAAVSEAN